MRIRERFNPRAPCGARPDRAATGAVRKRFQPTRPLRGATLCLIAIAASYQNFNPRAPCDAPVQRKRFPVPDISTHAPLAGRDEDAVTTGDILMGISTHAPLAGRDFYLPAVSTEKAISTHAPLAGRDIELLTYMRDSLISTHAPLAGRDSKSVQITMHIFAITDKFQMLLHRMPPVRAFCSFLMQENHADFGCEPPK